MTSIIKSILVVVLAMSYVQSNAQTKIIAHRGFSGVAPENTLVAFQKAIDCKADYFELDVHKTKDDSLVVIHDSNIDRTSSNRKKGKIAELNYNDLATAKVGYKKKFGKAFKNEKIPSLKESLELAKGKIKVCIELKVYGIEKEVLELINQLEMNEEVIIFSFYYPVLAKIRQLDKNIPTLLLIDSADKLTIDYAKLIEVSAIGVGYKTKITTAYLDFAHDNGIEVWKWTVNEEDEMQQLIAVGLDGIITNYPNKAINQLNINK